MRRGVYGLRTGSPPSPGGVDPFPGPLLPYLRGLRDKPGAAPRQKVIIEPNEVKRIFLGDVAL